MHSPLALIHAVTVLSDITDIQTSFCKIIIAIAKTDEVARENFIRFQVQQPLVRLIMKQHAELSKIACMTITELCVKDHDIRWLCENNHSLIDSIVALLDAMPHEFRIQMEGLRVLVTIDNKVPDIMITIKKLSFFQILKRTKKYLNSCIKLNQIPSDYDVKDVEDLLESVLWTKEKCIIS